MSIWVTHYTRMLSSFIHGLSIFALLGTVASMGYYALCLWSAFSFLKERDAVHAKVFTPPVSILKPLKGNDPEIYESFRSHCMQDYSEYEIIFGVSDPHDPAMAEVTRLQKEFPHRDIRLVHC